MAVRKRRVAAKTVRKVVKKVVKKKTRPKRISHLRKRYSLRTKTREV